MLDNILIEQLNKSTETVARLFLGPVVRSWMWRLQEAVFSVCDNEMTVSRMCVNIERVQQYSKANKPAFYISAYITRNAKIEVVQFVL